MPIDLNSVLCLSFFITENYVKLDKRSDKRIRTNRITKHFMANHDNSYKMLKRVQVLSPLLIADNPNPEPKLIGEAFGFAFSLK